jgi:hypothetical protein
MSEMARLTFGQLREAWKGEATDFTPLLAEQLDALGDAIGVDLMSIGEVVVATDGCRSIDIVAHGDEGATFVIENQCGRSDHDHLTRGLAYAVAARARGLVVVTEAHRDEFRAVADYLNALAEHDAEHGIVVWLVEARAVRIADSPWAPLFSTVAAPKNFTRSVEQARQTRPNLESFDAFLALATPDVRGASRELVQGWEAEGHQIRLGPTKVLLEARGPSANG